MTQKNKTMEKKSEFIAKCKARIEWSTKLIGALPRIQELAREWGQKVVNKRFGDAANAALEDSGVELAVEKDWAGRFGVCVRDKNDPRTRTILGLGGDNPCIGPDRRWDTGALAAVAGKAIEANRAAIEQNRRSVEEFDVWFARRKGLIEEYRRMEEEMPQPLRQYERLATRFLIDC